MKSLRLIVLLCIFSTFFLFKNADALEKQQGCKLKAEIEKIIHNKDPHVNIGIEIISLKTGERVFQKNAEQLFVPASCLKLITTAAALYKLGVDYHFVTKLYTDGKIEGKALRGNIYLQGSGDPELGLQDLEELVTQVKLLGIQKIEGNLYIDNTLFDEVSTGPGWMWDDVGYYSQSPMDALVLNHSCVEVWVKPAEQLGLPATFSLIPQTGYVSIENHSQTSREENSLLVERHWKDRGNLIDIKGQIPICNEAKKYLIPVNNPSLYAAHVFRENIQNAHILLEGRIDLRKTPRTASLLAIHESRPLSLIVEEMNKVSDNLIADCLFKKIGEYCLGAPGSWQKGSQAIKDFLSKEVGMNTERMMIVDGCGLSRYNLISPHQIVELLKWVHEKFNHQNEFLASLPISGIDGSLISRLTKDKTKTKVRAKTGTMTGVTGIAGYLTTCHDEIYAFAIIQNGFVERCIEYKTQIEDEICALLINDY